MNTKVNLLIAAVLGFLTTLTPAASFASQPGNQITILYDAFGTDPAMTKDWGFSALVEVAGKRIHRR